MVTAASAAPPVDQAILLFTPEWTGMHPGAWRLPGSPIDGAMDFDEIVSLVRMAEQAKLHGMFLADLTGFRLEVSMPNVAKTSTGARFEPFTLMSALSMCTSQIGLIMTAGTTYDEPYHVARRFASLDHLSKGRAGWNIVTTGNQAVAARFGQAKHMEHDLRYDRGVEFVEAVTALWDSFEDGAFVRDKESGTFFDVDRLHVAKQRGAYINIEGPLNVERSVQGWPVLAQAGSSTTGRAFAARFAEVMFTMQPNIEAAREFRGGMRAAVADAGRSPDSIKIMVGLTLVVGETDEDAEATFALMDSLVDDDLGLEILESKIDADLAGVDLDGPLPDIAETALGTRTIQQFFVEMARRESLTVRQLISRVLRWGAIGGSPTTIADHIETWLRAGAADGFNVTFADMPGSMTVFCEQVVPELQRRGLFQTDYTGTTLREHLGLERPAHVGVPEVSI